MTTSQTPLRILKQQADTIARKIKECERGEIQDIAFAEKIWAARSNPSFKVGIVMDDKVIVVDLPWKTIRLSSEVALAELILKQMKGSREH